MRVALLDADYIPFITCYNKKDEVEKDIHKILKQTDSYITNLLKEVDATHYIGALTIGKCFRYSLNLDYKANRKDFIPMKYSKAVKEYLKDKWGFISHPDLEADDIVNICNKSTWFIGEDSIEAKSFIISPDKDLLYLEGVNYNPNRKEWITVDSIVADYRFWISMIIGDTADNIKGIPGIGIKGSEKILNEDKDYTGDYRDRVFNAYLKYLGQDLGIDEFYKNYKCLKIVDNWESFKVPDPVRFEIDKSESKKENNTKEEVKE